MDEGREEDDDGGWETPEKWRRLSGRGMHRARGFAAGCLAHLVDLADGRIVGIFGVDHGPAAVSAGAAWTAVDTRGLDGDCDAS